MDDYTLYSDGDHFVAFGLDALWVSGYGPGEPFVTLQIGGGMMIATFRADVKDVVFGALREARKKMKGIIKGLIADGYVESKGEESPTLCAVKKLKVSVREFIEIQLDANGVIRDELEHTPFNPVFNVTQ